MYVNISLAVNYDNCLMYIVDVIITSDSSKTFSDGKKLLLINWFELLVMSFIEFKQTNCTLLTRYFILNSAYFLPWK